MIQLKYLSDYVRRFNMTTDSELAWHCKGNVLMVLCPLIPAAAVQLVVMFLGFELSISGPRPQPYTDRLQNPEPL